MKLQGTTQTPQKPSTNNKNLMNELWSDLQAEAFV